MGLVGRSFGEDASPSDEGIGSRSRPFSLIIATVGLVALAATGAWAWSTYIAAPEASERAPGAAGSSPALDSVPVVACGAEQRDVPVYRIGIGSVHAFNTIDVTPRVEGELVSVLFKDGQDVKVGDVLAKVDNRRYAIALRQAEATVARDTARLSLSNSDMRRAADLLGRGAGSAVAAETQRATFAQIQADLASSTAQRDRAALDLDYTTVRAPIAGRIGLRNVDPGNYVRPMDQTPIAVITEMKPVYVVFSLPEDDLARVRGAIDSNRPLAVTALDRDMRTPVAVGTLSTIDSSIDLKSGTFRLKAMFDNAQRKLWPGQFVNARLLLGTIRDATTVPAQAVQRGPDGTFVFVVAAGRADIRKVEIAQLQENEAVIERGIAPGEIVVLDGQYRLERGTPVRLAGDRCDGRSTPNVFGSVVSRVP